MTREDVIRMLREANSVQEDYFSPDHDNIAANIRFANLVAAAEREACAKVCDAEAAAYLSDMKVVARNCAAAIRARGSDLLEEAWEQAIK